MILNAGLRTRARVDAFKLFGNHFNKDSPSSGPELFIHCVWDRERESLLRFNDWSRELGDICVK